MSLQEKELPKTFTFVNLQGELNQEYKAELHKSNKPRRANQAASWPKDAADNIERLKKAGMPIERGVPKCQRCDGESAASSM